MGSITEYAFKNKVVIYFLLLLITLGGVISYVNMGKLEDAKFTLKVALVVTPYPGASPHEVEQEVTEVIERAVNEMEYIDYVTTSSYAGLSIVEININDRYKSEEMSQIWDILRNKISDASGELPEGAIDPQVIDDFGDVFGTFYAITGDGFSYEELKEYSEYMKKELLTVDMVGKIKLFGNQSECIDIIVNDAKLSELGVNPGLIIAALQTQTNIAPSGNIELVDRYVRVSGNSPYGNINDISNTIIQVGPEQFYLKDFAEIKKSYVEPAQETMNFNGSEAIGLGISAAKGANVIVLNENLNKKIATIEANLPVGVELNPIYNEAKEVEAATNTFVVNLIESIAIVFVILLLFMGVRSGLLIASGLIFSILGTIVVMYSFDIALHRSSLAAIIIAMGMLVDNAIVVTDGALVDIQRGLNPKKAILNVSRLTAMPLLGATIIAILAFLPVFLSPSTAGEINRDLFLVLAISLSLSWIFAMTQSAITNERFLKAPKAIKEDPYDTRMYIIFKNVLTKIIKHKWISTAILFMLLIFGFGLFGNVKQAFFTPLEKSYLVVDYWLPEGSSLNKVDHDLTIAEDYLSENVSEIVNITTSLSQTPPRYMLMAITQSYNSSFGQLMIETHDSDEAVSVRPEISKYFAENYPEARVQISGYIAGPPIPYKVEARFMGPDPAVLRELSEKAKNAMHNIPECIDIQDDWRNQVMTWSPEFSPIKAKRTGITRSDLGAAIQRSTSSGLIVGMYREDNEHLPLVLKVENDSKNSIKSISNTGVWPRMGSASVPLKEVVDDIDLSWENSVIKRYNQQRAITVQCNPIDVNMSGTTLLSLVQADIEAIELPDGYSLMWDGEYKKSKEAGEATGIYFPLAMLLIVLIIIMLFNNVRQSLVVILIIPLQILGVAVGLFITGNAFGFMAIVGFLGLMGMVLKNAIVLMDQIKINLEKEGVIPFNAIIKAAISRARPVILAALTTMLGMMPLIGDAMFASMAVTIIFGLLFATVLTLIAVPLLYAVFFKVNAPQKINQ